jgi:DNA-binding NarL/FixJ family response regulator
MNLLICHDVRFFGEAMKRWLAESGKVSVVGVVTDPESQLEPGVAADAEIVSSRLISQYLAARSANPEAHERRGRRVLLVAERTPRALALARLHGFDDVVDAKDLDAPLDEFVERLEKVVTAPADGSAPELIDVYTLVDKARTLATGDSIDERIVDFVAQGLADKQIAKAMGLSVQTIRNRVSRMLIDSGLRNRTELAVQYVRNHPEVPGLDLA